MLTRTLQTTLLKIFCKSFLNFSVALIQTISGDLNLKASQAPTCPLAPVIFFEKNGFRASTFQFVLAPGT